LFEVKKIPVGSHDPTCFGYMAHLSLGSGRNRDNL